MKFGGPPSDRHGQDKAIDPVSWSLSPGAGSSFLPAPDSNQLCSEKKHPPLPLIPPNARGHA